MATAAGGLNLDDLGNFTATVQAGDFVFREGDAAAELFVIQDGRVDLLAGDGKVATLEAGGIFGERGVFDSGTRDVSAQAATDVRLIRLTRPAFDRVVAEAPQVAVSMLQQLATRAGAQQSALHDALARAASPASSPAPVTRGEPSLVEADSGTRFPLAGFDEATVGRPDRATGFVPEVDLTAVDVKRTLSRRHAKLVRRDGRIFVREEAGTRNGTFVNGTRVATGAEVELHDGDQVQFGFVKTAFEWP